MGGHLVESRERDLLGTKAPTPLGSRTPHCHPTLPRGPKAPTGQLSGAPTSGGVLRGLARRVPTLCFKAGDTAPRPVSKEAAEE